MSREITLLYKRLAPFMKTVDPIIYASMQPCLLISYGTARSHF